MPKEAEEAAIACLKRLDPASQLEVLRRHKDLLQLEIDTDSSRLRRFALALHHTRRICGRARLQCASTKLFARRVAAALDLPNDDFPEFREAFVIDAVRKDAG